MPVDELPEESQAFRALVDELTALLEGVRQGPRDKKRVFAAAARRFELEQQLLRLLSPAGLSQERRRNVRVPCALPVKVAVGTGEVDAVALDVSFSGIRVQGPLTVQQGQPLGVTVPPSPGLCEHGLRARGTVNWTRGDQVGLLFAAQDPVFSRQLLLLVLALLRQAKPAAR